MQVLLISTYELGRQPTHVASPAGALVASGHEVRAADTAVAPIRDEDIEWADMVAISVPMHTATRLADELVVMLREKRPDLPISFYGLYAAVGGADVNGRFSGEYEPALLRWVAGDALTDQVHTGKSDFVLPAREILPELGEYARMEWGGNSVVAGSVESTHGCRHRCRHCPLPTVYDGRIRVVPKEVVLGDIDNLVGLGAKHLSFGDPDFLNAPAHAVSVLEGAHQRHPELTFDATIKVSHILKHADLIPQLAASGLLFVVSAFESTDDDTLQILDKNHTSEDMAAALDLLRRSGVFVRPTWLPFMPWTTVSDIADIFAFLARHDLASATDPVQMAIKLLVPPGSLLADHESMRPYLGELDKEALVYPWEFDDGDTELLWKRLDSIAADASECGGEALATLEQMRRTVQELAGDPLPAFVESAPVPRMTESWFCCAEPTPSQAVTISFGS